MNSVIKKKNKPSKLKPINRLNLSNLNVFMSMVFGK